MGFDADTAGLGDVRAANLGMFGALASLGMHPRPVVDKFGLPLNWSLLSETEEQRIKRIVAVMDLLREAYEAAAIQLGARLAKVAWKHTIKGKPGRPRGRRNNPNQDAELLRIYDAASPQMDEKRRRSAPRLIASYVKENHPRDFPVSVGSIETRIRRLIKGREAERAARDEADRKLAAAMLGRPNLFGFGGTLVQATGGNALAGRTGGLGTQPAPDKNRV